METFFLTMLSIHAKSCLISHETPHIPVHPKPQDRLDTSDSIVKHLEYGTHFSWSNPLGVRYNTVQYPMLLRQAILNTSFLYCGPSHLIPLQRSLEIICMQTHLNDTLKSLSAM